MSCAGRLDISPRDEIEALNGLADRRNHAVDVPLPAATGNGRGRSVVLHLAAWINVAIPAAAAAVAVVTPGDVEEAPSSLASASLLPEELPEASEDGDGTDASSALAPSAAPRADAPQTKERRRQADALYRQYGPVVYRRCLTLLRDREAARDATQEVFVKLLRRMDRLDDREYALAWAYRVATNHCLNVIRDSRELADEASAQVEGADRPASYADVQLARAILTRCDAQMRAIAVGVFVEEMEHEEVADALGLSRRTVGRKLKRFLEQSRKYADRTESSPGSPRRTPS